VKAPHWFDAGQPVVLADGRVLLVEHGDGSAAVWDPATGRMTRTESLNKARSGFAAIRLTDGRVLVAGGLNEANQSYSSAYTWDPRDGTWTKVGLMTQARAAPSIAALPDGQILVAGGYYAFEPDWGFAAPDGVASTAVARPGDAAPATLTALVPPVADVDVPPSGRALATAEIFDPRSGEWSSARPMRYARAGAEAVTLADGRILVASVGPHNVDNDWDAYLSAEVYDPATGRWALVDEVNWIPWRELREQGVPDWMRDINTGGDILSTGTLVALGGGNAALIGHSEWAKHQGEETRSFVLDADARSWREIGTPWLAGWENEPPYRDYASPGPRLNGAAAVTLTDGHVLVAGGARGGMEVEGNATRVARLYDPATDTWAKLPKLPEPWGGAAVLLADGSALLVDGGRLLRFVP
jgi:hypothetical protein